MPFLLLLSPAMLLVGRSGTGKTTCAIYRLYFAWEAAMRSHREEPFHQLFVTASATLRQQVESSFRKLQNAVRPPTQGESAVAAAVPRSFLPEDVPEECAGLDRTSAAAQLKDPLGRVSDD